MQLEGFEETSKKKEMSHKIKVADLGTGDGAIKSFPDLRYLATVLYYEIQYLRDMQ